MKRRDFLKNIFVLGTGLALAPELAAGKLAEAAWQTGGELPGVVVQPTYLHFRSLTNRTRTDAIVVHHIGNTNADVSAATVHEWHLANGWAGIGYHYVIRKDGTIEQGRPLGTVGAHCYGENYHTVGVNIVGNFEIAEPEPAQMASAARLLAAICRFYGFAPGSDTIFGHRDFNATACPGENLYVRLPELIRMTQAQY
ncbi:MAG: N-acetylmuramoyl-L-alanine amidase [Selenomonas sp.]|jgi:N-acetyl-anhydromuramyl-L-alanine amidase AmpD|nr:N-acetylmuramoyl-L-alanine amidase [Selenomonas sp.]MCI7330411.1 N-acetylmuramoyl-L-alanine amidase [Selenomonadaceae bacterium]MDD6119668.1 N-acetylmuramoyl-L-alanine amidase [Selenomonadaceae bacterium]MDD7056637.1 N-acetylmuramoyl-L-alanine amidase [Selenomonadaceae bacterium]